jgi:16S rRNA (guanine527-N7)-methyltransferase
LLTNINTYEKFSSHVFVSRETYKKLCMFQKILFKWQKSINLISKNTIKNTWERHFLDSAQLYKFVKSIEGNIVDFGSGAGFPGLVLAIMGKKNIHLVESDYKKCVFLKEIAMLTETDITIHNCRIEDLSLINVDLITCRALASLSKLIDYVEIFINKSLGENQKLPKLLFLKGKCYHSEVVELSKNKKICFEEYPSITDKNGRILYINKVDKLNNEYD